MRSLIKLIKKTYLMEKPRERKVVIHNAASLSLLQLINYILPVILIPYLFRVIGPERFGLLAFAQAFLQYFMLVTDYGFSVSATKEISLYRDDADKINKTFSSIMTVKIVLLLLSFITLSVIIYFIPRFRQDWLVYVLGFGAVVGNAIFPSWFFQGTEAMKYISGLNILGGLTFACLILIFVREPVDYLMVPSIYSCVFMLSGVLGQYFVLRKFRVRFLFTGFKDAWRRLKQGWDVFISIAAINAYTTTRVFAVGLFTNNSITGFYSIAERIANVPQTFPLNSFSQAIFPRLSKIFHKNKKKAIEIMRHTQQITIIISLICLPFFFILTPVIVKLVCGDAYPETVLVLRLLLISVFFIHANAFRVQFLLVCGKTDVFSKIHVTMAIAGLPLIFLLIYYFSYTGAAAATIAIEAAIFTLTYFALRRLP